MSRTQRQPTKTASPHKGFTNGLLRLSSSQWARRDRLMSRGKNCRETIFVSHLSRNYPHRGVNFEEKSPLLWGRDSLGGILGDNLGEGNCESKIASRQWGDNFCRETSICLAGPSGFWRSSTGFPWGPLSDPQLVEKRAPYLTRRIFKVIFFASMWGVGL